MRSLIDYLMEMVNHALDIYRQDMNLVDALMAAQARHQTMAMVMEDFCGRMLNDPRAVQQAIAYYEEKRGRQWVDDHLADRGKKIIRTIIQNGNVFDVDDY